MMNPLYGEPSVRTLPANQSLVLADSLYRNPNDPNQGPYDFVCELGGSALVGKQLIYERLYWSQPLFSHTNASNELRFQINGDTSITYVVYATPYLMFNQYDGNAPGTSFLNPKLYSYASNMELGLNNDIRDLTSNFIPIHGTGQLLDADGFTMYARFRYSPSRGFVFTFDPSTNISIPTYTIRLLPCSYIENAHYVHGFGVTNSESPNQFIPRDTWTAAYFSDDTPTLLPSRYIVVTSKELNKDRRMISFQNSASSNFLNELAIIYLSSTSTGAFHSEVMRDDATVISKRDDYNPQSFRITILDEKGEVLRCDDPLGNFMASDLYQIYPSVKASFLFGPLANRGNSLFTNAMLYGSRPLVTAANSYVSLHINANVGQGVRLFTRNSCPYDLSFNNPAVFTTGAAGQDLVTTYGFPLIVTETVMPPNGANIGFTPSITTYTSFVHNNDAYPGTGVAQNVYSTRFHLLPSANTALTVLFDLQITVDINPANIPNFIYFWVGLYSFSCGKFFYGKSFPMAAKYVIPNGTPMQKTVIFATIGLPIQLEPVPTSGNAYNPDEIQACGFFVVPYDPLASTTTNQPVNFYAFSAISDRFIIGTNNVIPEHTYIPPNAGGEGQSNYSFGDPQASGLCEDLIHEISTHTKEN